LYKVKKRKERWQNCTVFWKISIYMCVVYNFTRNGSLKNLLCASKMNEFENEVDKTSALTWSMCNFKQSTCTLILWQVWLRNHMHDIQVPWFFNCFKLCDFSYVLHVARHSLLWSNSKNENLCLRKYLILTKWCLLPVADLIMAHESHG